MTELFSEIHQIILTEDAQEKCNRTHALHDSIAGLTQNHDNDIKEIKSPGYPSGLQLVSPRQLKRRGIQTQQGRNILLHAIAHIEFNAINLALDAAYRFRHQPQSFYVDWVKIACDEARHFELIRAYLNSHNCDYGDFQAHNGLWDMAIKTQHDIVARMALVPRVLEARGLDVTPSMIQRLNRVADKQAVSILEVIYQDEIGHVETGSRWFRHHCQLRNLEPRSTFLNMVKTHLHGELRGPFNTAARLLAGFDETEMKFLNEHY